MISTTLAAAVVAAPVLGFVAHELTHAAAARALGADIEAIDLFGGEVRFRADERTVTAVRYAPGAIGMLLLPLPMWLTLSFSAWAVPVTLFWAVYALGGGDGEPGPMATAGDGVAADGGERSRWVCQDCGQAHSFEPELCAVCEGQSFDRVQIAGNPESRS